MKFCPNCGAKITNPDAQFCMNCGQKLPPAQKYEELLATEDVAQQDAGAPAQQTPPVDDLFEEGEAVTAAPAGDLFADAQDQPPVEMDLFGGQASEAEADAPAEPAPPQTPADLAEQLPQQPETPSAAAPLQPLPEEEAAPSEPPDIFTTASAGQAPPESAAAAPALADEAPAPLSAESIQKRIAASIPDLDDPVPDSPAAPKQPAQTMPAAQQEDLLSLIEQAQTRAPQQAEPQWDAPAAAPFAAPEEEFSPPAPQRPAPQQSRGRATPARPQHGASADAPAPEEPIKRPPPPPPELHSTDEQTVEIQAPQPRKPAAMRPTPPPVPLPPQPQSSSGGAGRRVITFVLLVVVFLVVAAVTLFAILYFNNSATKTVDKFIEAVSTSDTATLQEMASVNGTTADENGWRAFCAAFSQPASLNTLKSQLLMQADDAENAMVTYPAITVESQPFLFVLQRYTVRVQAVHLLAPDAADGTVLRLNGTEYTGQHTTSGMLYTGLMPGRYQCQLVPPGTDAATVTPLEIEMFEVSNPNTLAGSAPRATITIENCLSDEATLYVNDMPVTAKPQGGVVTLADVVLGSTIRIALVDSGVPKEASVVFSDAAQTTLRFDNYVQTTAPGISGSSSSSEADSEAVQFARQMGKDSLNAAMGVFYPSYLSAINEQNIELIKMTTDSAKTYFATRITSEGNRTNRFEYNGVQCDADTIEATELNGNPCVRFTATFRYRYIPREGEGEWKDAENRQTVELVYIDGEWLVNKMEFATS